jgi:cell division protein FtsI (penicillin-binding protein 3)
MLESISNDIVSFTANLPTNKPRYHVLTMLDEPQGWPETSGHADGRPERPPVGGTVISRIAPPLGLEPRFELPTSDKLILASAREAR